MGNVRQCLARAHIAVALTVTCTFLVSGCATRGKPLRIVEVSPGIFEGPRVHKQADFDLLKAHGVRTILSLEALPWDIWPERRRALQNGIEYVNVPIMATPLEPREKRVNEALMVLDDRSLRPIYVHCYLGEDRDTFLIGLYRVYFQHWTPEAAWDEMLRSGFHVRLTLRGFRTYFWRHAQEPPPWAKVASARKKAP